LATASRDPLKQPRQMPAIAESGRAYALEHFD